MKVTKRFRILANLSCIGMLLVLLAGALVTNTDSGRGCGDDWPLCNGKFIPAYTVESMIEYSHRAVSGLEGILVATVFFMIYRQYKRERKVYREPMQYAWYALLFTIIQALMGAAAVMWPQSPPIMAIHFGISLVAFAATLLLVIWCYRDKRGIVETTVFPRQIMPWALAASIYCYVVVYLGAFIRHTESAGGCLGWPLCNGEVIPELSGATGIAFIHRVGAAILGIVLIALYFYIKRLTGNSSLTKTAQAIVILVLAQIASGAWLVNTIGSDNWFLFTSLLHNLIIVALFGMLVDLVIRSWIYRKKN
ncbi:heme A synthase [Paenibacillus montaniterrae]|uniref:Heme A synthase n=1 Tax=Paenibacillus montaniterrae TaxID=429341 RepID=A0A919YJT9_9BACL|nr:COX15/CtaA family protein [Paenibacillus montaniterrae]GIP15707.1 heme A synthase [Paenibacillus montaniterrae]